MSSISSWLGRMLKPEERRILFLGLDASGRTTALYKLKLGQVITTIPTIGFNVETIRHRHICYTIWDVGGCDKIRPLWRHYFQNADACVFFVDGTAVDDRLEESLEEFRCLVAEEVLRNVPFLVVLSKADLPCPVDIQDLREKIGHCAQVLRISAVNREGMGDMLDWLHDNAGKHRVEHVANRPNLSDDEEAEMLRLKFESWQSRKDPSEDDFIEQLRNYTLDSWDHYTHLRIPFIFLRRYGRREGMKRVFTSIKNFIDNSSVATNFRGSRFHETMTYFWTHMVHYALAAHPTDDFKQFLFFNPQLANGGLFLEYYSSELMLRNPDSRICVCLPDKKHLPSLLSDTSTMQSPHLVPMNDSDFLSAVRNEKSPSVGHEARIRAIWCTLHFANDIRAGRKDAFDVVQRMDGVGYHLTMTYFWIQMITLAMTVADAGTFHEFVEMKHSRHLREEGHIHNYYSEQVLERGVKEMILPDIKQMPNVIS